MSQPLQCLRRIGVLLLPVAFFMSVAAAEPGQPQYQAAQRTLTFEDRVAAQQAIERVYYSHRIGATKPFEEAVPRAALENRVNKYLEQAAALEVYWKTPVTNEMLQRELERMAHNTRMPQRLRELFAALDDDPFLIAECLARPELTQRLVESAFASDERIHGAQRAALASKLAGVEDIAALERVDGDHAEITFVLDDGAAAKRAPAGPTDRAIRLTREAWNREIARLVASFDIAREPDSVIPSVVEIFFTPVDVLSKLPVGRVSRLLDRGDQFAALAVRVKSATSVTALSVTWTKRTYGEWAREAAASTLDASAIATPAQGYSVPALPSSGCSDDTWMPTTASAGQERASHTAVWTGTEMIVWGGYNIIDFVPLNTGGRYNPSTDTWTATSTGANVPDARYGHTAVWTGDEMIVWGAGNTGGRYNPSTDTWTATSTGPNVPAGRSSHTAVWTGAEMIVWGGYSGGYPNTGGRYNPSTDTWTATSTGANVPAGRGSHTAVWTGTEMIVWGGYSGGYLNTGGRYNPSTDTWAATSTGANVPAGRNSHTAVWTGTEMIVWGGWCGACEDSDVPQPSTGGRYNPSTDTWTATSGGPGARSEHTAVWTGAEMIVWGGYYYDRDNSDWYDLNTGGRYKPSTDSWTDVGGPIPGRGGHTAVWAGTEMIVWGGYNSIQYPSVGGGRYNPATNSWVTIGTILPAARAGHTAVWTGAEMIVWGGYFICCDLSGVNLNTGGRYNPATDSWATSSLATAEGPNVPGPRSGHTAVWTGTEMIVWGGGASLNTGGRYNPSTDTWAATSTGANVPAGRSSHTAVWTGTEMIVWGGGASLNTGGRYNPSTDTWTATSTGANVPAGRSSHTAVWTGTELIVWGGYSGGYLNTGGRYNPSTDTWTATSTGANVPAGRSSHTAVWAGTEMIVWGGGYSGGYFNTGGRYNPSTDAWAATSTGPNDPYSHAVHTAVWTGAEMIIWGGGIGGESHNTGGRYNPSTDTWTATSTGANVPARRTSHTAVWTGTEMIIWGGSYGYSQSLYTGGRYCACTALVLSYGDADGDNFGDATNGVTTCSESVPSGNVPNGTDCEDGDAAVYPSAPQLCDGINNDCSDAAWPELPESEVDADDDGFRTCAGDCDDDEASVHPGAPEICDGIGNDCSDTAWPELPASEADADDDGFRACADCNDSIAFVYPGAIEVCNGTDDDCDTQVDEDASGLDSDADGVHNACDNCPVVSNPSQVDTDGDGAGTSCDNCAFVPNPFQDDVDSDGRGDICDNCPSDYNSFQDDWDADRVGDACDNCVFEYNPYQVDLDSDFEGDYCDSDDGLIYIRFWVREYVEWQEEDGFDTWNSYKGSLGVLRATCTDGSCDYTQATGSNPLAHQHCGLADPWAEDFTDPAADQAVFFLTTGVARGIESSLGNDSHGAERANENPCP